MVNSSSSSCRDLLTTDVKLFAFTHISNSLGTINPVERLRRSAEQLAVTLVDAAQSADSRSMCRRWAAISSRSPDTRCARRRASARSTAARASRLHAALARRRRNDRERHLRTRPTNRRHRFEAGTPNIADAVGLGAAIDYLDSDRPRRSSTRQRSPFAPGTAGGHPGVRVLGPRKERGGRRLRHGVGASTRSHDLCGPVWDGAPRGASLQSAADEEIARPGTTRRASTSITRRGSIA